MQRKALITAASLTATAALVLVLSSMDKTTRPQDQPTLESVPEAGAAPLTSAPAALDPGSTDPFTAARAHMVRSQLAERDITDARVLAAMGSVPRHLFVEPEYHNQAYNDHPLPIGHDQTISQPYIVAYMTQAIGPQPNQRVLEIGTGSGYQAAVLAELVAMVYTIEIVAPLAAAAKALCQQLGYDNVRFRTGDGYNGWPEHAPFDAIIVTAAPDHIPPALVEQLATGGRMIIPVGTSYQELIVVEKTATGTITRQVMAVRFVPFVRAPVR